MFNRWTLAFSALLWLAIGSLVSCAVSAAEAPGNVAAVQTGDVVHVTWTHPGDAPGGFMVWVGNVNLDKGAPLPADARARTLTGQPAELCGITVLARYAPDGINLRSSPSVCATQEAPEPEPEPGPLQTIRVTLTPPTERVDGSALPASEIAGYFIYYGPEDPPTESSVFVGCCSAELELGEGIWYLAGQTQDTDGTLSDLSAPATRVTVQPPVGPAAAPRAPSLSGVEILPGT